MVTGWYKAPPEETTSFRVPCHGGRWGRGHSHVNTFCSGDLRPLWKGVGWGVGVARVGGGTIALLGLPGFMRL